MTAICLLAAAYLVLAMPNGAAAGKLTPAIQTDCFPVNYWNPWDGQNRDNDSPDSGAGTNGDGFGHHHPGNQGPTGATGPTSETGPTSGTGVPPAVPPVKPNPLAARFAADCRRAIPPKRAPAVVKKAVRTANQLTKKPYLWGGGHASWVAKGYDCSGATSYVLHKIGRLGVPMVSGSLKKWGVAGAGKWITVYANKEHVFMVIAGMRFDTSGAGDHGPRWRAESRSYDRFVVRHPAGL